MLEDDSHCFDFAKVEESDQFTWPTKTRWYNVNYNKNHISLIKKNIKHMSTEIKLNTTKY